MHSADLRLHTQAGKVLDLLADDPQAGRRYYDLPPEESRRVADARRALLNIEPEEVAKVEQRDIPGPGGPIPIRVYVPHGALASGPLPVFVHFHGGGFVLCSIDSHDPQCRYWANHSGCIVVSVDYRLAPESKFPAAVEDCLAVTRWVAEHGRGIGADGDRIAVGGESAGGNLAAVVAQIAARESGPAILLQVLAVPIVDMRFESPAHVTYAKGYGLERATLEWFRHNYLNGESEWDDPRASPLRATELGGLPPALVVTAGFDPLRDDGRAYADRLALAGVPVEHICYEGLPHPFVGWGRRAPIVIEYMDRVAGALRHALLDGR